MPPCFVYVPCAVYLDMSKLFTVSYTVHFREGDETKTIVFFGLPVRIGKKTEVPSFGFMLKDNTVLYVSQKIFPQELQFITKRIM